MSDFESKVIVMNDGVYKPRKYNPEDVEYDTKYAYIKDTDNPDAIFYPYRGRFKLSSKLPGMYKYIDGEVVLPKFIEPNETEKADYVYSTHVVDASTDNIIKICTENEHFHYSFPEGSTFFVPDIKNNDDILKRAIKLALKAKNIEIDSCKDRFLKDDGQPDKNALFNFKQAIRNDKKVSILIFIRGCEALGLKYSIVLEEANPNETIGTSLNDKEAIKNVIRNVNDNSILIDKDNNTEVPDKVKNNFRNDSLDLKGKIIVSSDDTFED